MAIHGGDFGSSCTGGRCFGTSTHNKNLELRKKSKARKKNIHLFHWRIFISSHTAQLLTQICAECKWFLLFLMSLYASKRLPSSDTTLLYRLVKGALLSRVMWRENTQYLNGIHCYLSWCFSLFSKQIHHQYMCFCDTKPE